MPSHRVPYSDPFGTGNRPYLSLQVTGINGQQGTIVGLLDTGADCTSLPYGYAPLMGYSAIDLRQASVAVADGSNVPVWIATRPSSAYVVGLPSRPFSITPTFVQGNPPVLWGRADVFMTFGFAFQESQAAFTLIE